MILQETHVFQDFAGHDLVVLTFLDNSESVVIPVFLTTEQQHLWELMNEHVDPERYRSECVRHSAVNGQENRRNSATSNARTNPSRKHHGKRAKTH